MRKISIVTIDKILEKAIIPKKAIIEKVTIYYLLFFLLKGIDLLYLYKSITLCNSISHTHIQFPLHIAYNKI